MAMEEVCSWPQSTKGFNFIYCNQEAVKRNKASKEIIIIWV